eukprot:sb/3476893/
MSYHLVQHTTGWHTNTTRTLLHKDSSYPSLNPKPQPLHVLKSTTHTLRVCISAHCIIKAPQFWGGFNLKISISICQNPGIDGNFWKFLEIFRNFYLSSVIGKKHRNHIFFSNL